MLTSVAGPWLRWIRHSLWREGNVVETLYFIKILIGVEEIKEAAAAGSEKGSD
jgi:hypothetical protein